MIESNGPVNPEVFMLPRSSVKLRDVMDADLLVRGMGESRALEVLEKVEPILASYVMESSARIHGELGKWCASNKRAEAIHGDMMLLMLISIEAVRRSA